MGIHEAFKTTRRGIMLAALGAMMAGGLAAPAAAADKPTSIGLDWALYNPLSVVLKQKGWMEEEFAKDGLQVRWQQSAGSNISLGLLNSGQVDFGSTAGAAALMGKINGAKIKAVYSFSRPEWTALVARKDKGITKVADLKGKRVAAARGTDPHIFLIRALAKAGLTDKDIQLVAMQHDNGRQALEAGDVDAWAGLDPLMAQSEMSGCCGLFYRAPEFNTFGILNVRQDFADGNPALVTRVLGVYDKARKWALENPAEVKAIMVAASGLPEAVIAKQLERTDLKMGALGDEQRSTITAAGNALKEAGVITGSVDVVKTVDDLMAPNFFRK
ncbi:MAG: aliphatic sulfonate ABC transporter substrate-binding protein [Solirubrobacterales bacterium]